MEKQASRMGTPEVNSGFRSTEPFLQYQLGGLTVSHLQI